MRNVLILFILIFVFVEIFYLFDKKYVSIKIEFEKLRPVKEKIDIYYNGFKIGKSRGIFPCEVSRLVCVDAILRKDAVFLPENLTARMKQRRTKNDTYEDFIEIIYPKVSSNKELSNGAKIKGELNIGFHNYLNEEVNFSDMENIKISLFKSAENLENATGILVDALTSIDDIVKNAKDELPQAFKNTNKTISDAKSVADKINSSIDEKMLQNSIARLNSTMIYADEFTQKLSEFDSVESVDSIARDTSDIVHGIKCTLKKQFGGLRLFFGRVIR